MTLIAVYKGNILIGRCDERCYNATQPHCDCICGGKNHGAGFHAAHENSKTHLHEWVDEYKRLKGLGSEAHHTFAETLFQTSLF